MAAEGFVAVGHDGTTLEDAGSVAGELSKAGLKLTRAQVLRAALAKGVADIKRDPACVFPSPSRRKKASA